MKLEDTYSVSGFPKPKRNPSAPENPYEPMEHRGKHLSDHYPGLLGPKPTKDEPNDAPTAAPEPRQ